MESAQRYPDWKAPAEDGQLLIWPPPSQIISDTLRNQTNLSKIDSLRIAQQPLNALRTMQRQALGHTDDTQPMIATGHQTELIHPGVWVKHVLINSAARMLNGRAFQFAVDTDGPKHLVLRWPRQSIPITDDPRLTTAAWCGLLDAPSPVHLARVADHVLDAAHDWDFKPLVPAVIASLRPESMHPGKLSAALMKANLDLDHSLGLEHAASLVSPMLEGGAWMALVHHLMCDAPAFAKVYNAALAAFRAAHKTRSPNRPMPDLFVSEQSVEAPFWLDNLTDGTRSRPSVFATPNGFVLQLLGGEEFLFDACHGGLEPAERLGRWLKQTNHRLSPRALTLTIFIRLFIADNFVHGIGGGRYDQVSDEIIRQYFKIDPPAFSVTTATMFFPGAADRMRVCIPCVLREGHRLKHAVLGEKKKGMLAEIESLPRRSMQRRTVFANMHRQRNERLATDSTIAKWEQRLRDDQARQIEDAAYFDRELFYAVQSRQRLLEMIERYDAAFCG